MLEVPRTADVWTVEPDIETADLLLNHGFWFLTPLSAT